MDRWVSALQLYIALGFFFVLPLELLWFQLFLEKAEFPQRNARGPLAPCWTASDALCHGFSLRLRTLIEPLVLVAFVSLLQCVKHRRTRAK